MRDIQPLVRVIHGSHLYGTNTSSSDEDYKGVHLPSGEAIILQRAENVIDRRIKLSDGLKNEAGDTDEQSYSLQKFFGMIAVGDTVATEILFAPRQFIVADVADWEHVQIIGKQLLNRQCKGFVGVAAYWAGRLLVRALKR